MSDYKRILPLGYLDIKRADTAPDEVRAALHTAFAQSMDGVAAALLRSANLLSEEDIYDPAGRIPEFREIKSLRIRVGLDSYLDDEPFMFCAFTNTSLRSQFWYPFTSKLTEKAKERLSAPFLEPVKALHAGDHTRRGPVFEYAVRLGVLSNHQRLALRAA